MQQKPTDTTDQLLVPETGRILPRVLEKAYSVDTLILDFWHTELGRINSCYFKPPRLWYLVMVALEKQIYPAIKAGVKGYLLN